MIQTSGENLSPAPGAAQQSGLKTTVTICYVLYLVGFIMFFTAIIGVIIAYIKKADAAGTVWESHFRNLIVVFWVTFAAFIVGLASLPISFYAYGSFFERDVSWPEISLLALPVVAAILIYLALFIWFLYRMIRGLLRAAEDRAY